MKNKIKVNVVSADMPGLISKLLDRGISVERIQQKDDLLYTCMLDMSAYNSACDIADGRGDTISIILRRGVGWRIMNSLHRPIVMLGMTILLALSLWLPTRVFFVIVEGNTQIPTNLILSESARCGICFGASRKAVRSEQVKNQLLSAIPELQWVGVNTRGCSAIISVSEKHKAQYGQDDDVNVSSIVAARDGVITSCTVQSGNQLCYVGEAVKSGQILVSGYVDCGLLIRTTEAKAEVTADTTHNLQTIIPNERTHRTNINKQITRCSLLIGKKLINFSKDSGILDAMCAKMYKTKYMTLPGGKVLPVALVMEERTYYETARRVAEPATAAEQLREYTEALLLRQMISGQILKSDYNFDENNDSYLLRGQYLCNEIISKTLREGRIYTDGEDI